LFPELVKLVIRSVFVVFFNIIESIVSFCLCELGLFDGLLALGILLKFEGMTFTFITKYTAKLVQIFKL
jgi:hypothetical protein